MTSNSHHFGKILHDLRKKKKMRQSDFVTKKLSQSHLSGIENNTRKHPSVQIFKEVIDILGIEPWVMLELMEDSCAIDYINLQHTISSNIKNYEFQLAIKDLNNYYNLTLEAPSKYYQFYLYQIAIIEAYSKNNWKNAKQLILEALSEKHTRSTKSYSLLEIEMMITLIVVYLTAEIDYLPITQISIDVLNEVAKYVEIINENIPFLKMQNKDALLAKYYINFCYYQQFVSTNLEKQIENIELAIFHAKKIQNYYLLFKANLSKASILAYNNNDNYLIVLQEARSLANLINNEYALKDYQNTKNYIKSNIINRDL